MLLIRLLRFQIKQLLSSILRVSKFVFRLRLITAVVRCTWLKVNALVLNARVTSNLEGFRLLLLMHVCIGNFDGYRLLVLVHVCISNFDGYCLLVLMHVC